MAARIWLVARHVVIETLSHRVIYFTIAFAVIVLAASRLVGPLSGGEETKVVKDLGLAAIEFAGVVLAILLGAGIVARESRRRSLLALLAKPIARWELLAGQLIGVALTIALNVFVMGLVLLLVLATMSPSPAGSSGPTPAADPRLIVALVLITAELAVLASVAVFFSVFSSSALVAAMFSAGLFVAGQLSGDLRQFGAAAGAPSGIGAVVSAIGWLLPAFSSFDVKAEVAHGVPISAGFVAAICGYAALYGTAVFAAAAALFARREFP
jgi:ABC-type transport system involved in multi-copper enzyme maturation permease subunit